jgi:N6-adenosine-specific RNA methylase IME4
MTETSALIQYDLACRALAQARSVDEVKDIRDKSDAMRIYARQAKNKDLEIDAAEIRIRAERRLGGMLLEQKDTVGLANGGDAMRARFLEGTEVKPTLADVGIDKKLSMRSQKVASIPDETFESMMGEWRERVSRENERVTVNLLNEQSRRDKDERQGEQQTASIHYLHRKGVYETDFDAIVNRVQSGLQEPYGCIYADPPWAYENQATRASTDNHYVTMSVDELMKLPVGEVAAERSHLHLWTTNAFLFECPRIFEAWGFEFKSSFIWVKPQMGMGNYWRNAHEFLLLAVRGGQTALDRSQRSWQEAQRKAHSAKPESVRSLVQKLSPGPYLELFGREFVDGWTVFGNECRNHNDGTTYVVSPKPLPWLERANP